MADPAPIARAYGGYDSARIALFRLACGHLVGCYEKDHLDSGIHAPRKTNMYCDEHLAWAEVMEKVPVLGS